MGNRKELPNSSKYKRIKPKFWGKGHKKADKLLVYQIHEKTLGIVYIGKQTNSTRITDFLKCYLALRKIFKKAKKGVSIDIFNGKVESDETDGYGNAFSIVSGLSNDLTQIIALANLCKKRGIDFSNLKFRIYVCHLSSKDKINKEEKQAIKEIDPPINRQLTAN